MPKNTYFFLFGRTPELSLQELQAVVPQEVDAFLPNLARVNVDSDQKAIEIFHQLGGCLKVLRLDGQFSDLSSEQLQEYVVAYLAEHARPTFAIAELFRNSSPKVDVFEVKNALKERGISSRFIEGPRGGLSASILTHHQNVVELVLIQDENQVYFAQTLAAQDIDDWTIRDREKPYADRKKGMLPPKVARMMLNLAIGRLEMGETAPAIYDPFCGSGTVLLEAAMRNCQVVGSDLDLDAVVGTQDNLTWFKQEYQKPELKAKVFQADVSGAKSGQIGFPVDAIVTEPFLGKPTPLVTALPNIFKGLEKMYLGAFKNWSHILRAGGIVVIVFPFVQAGKQTFSLEGMIDKLGKLGYTPLSEPVFYHRPQAVTQRQIWSFRFSK